MDRIIIKKFLQTTFLDGGKQIILFFVPNKTIEIFFQIKLTYYLGILKISSLNRKTHLFIMRFFVNNGFENL